MKKCIFCLNNYPTAANDKEREQLIGVCPKCESWKKKHMPEIRQHRGKLLSGFSLEKKREFEKMKPIEQAFITVRSMEHDLKKKPSK